MNPCCGGSLRTGTKIIAIFQLVATIIVVGALVSFKTAADCEIPDKPEGLDGTDIFLMVLGVVGISIPLILLLGAIKRNHSLCMVWYILTLIAVVYEIYNTIMQSVRETPTGAVVRNSPWGGILSVLLNSYFLWVVGAFMKEITEVGNSGTMQYGNLAKV